MADAAKQNILVFDKRLCTGCRMCEIACSFNKFNNTYSYEQTHIRHVIEFDRAEVECQYCQHCEDPLCLASCPVDAIHKDDETGIVKINPLECIGCQTCLKSCPFIPHRTVWKPAVSKATKCDLCTDSPHFSKPGGPSGEQACVVTCPMGALKLIHDLPSQTDISGYDVNLAPPPPPPGKFGPPGAKPKGAAKSAPKKQ